jgi:hypothetical protein
VVVTPVGAAAVGLVEVTSVVGLAVEVALAVVVALAVEVGAAPPVK